MRLLITDTGIIWNSNNSFLKKYKDIVLVVCLYGKKVSDEYECFISPYNAHFLGMDPYGAESLKFKALASVAESLNSNLSYHDDIVFLTDNEPTTLYPYYALENIIKYNRMHLVAMPPLYFEGKKRILGHRRLLADMSKLDAVLYYDINRKLEEFDKDKTLNEFIDLVIEELGNMMPRFLNGIHHMKERPCYFDFSSMEYVPLRNGFTGIDLKNKEKEVSEVDFPLMHDICTLGKILPQNYPREGDEIKESIERPVARLDGKKICNILRDQRIKLAKENNINFESEECPSIGACAGTCEKCDAEAAYLREEMKRIPEDKRIYPQFDPVEEVMV